MNILVGPNNCGKSTIIGAFRVLDIALRQARYKEATRVLGQDQRQYFGYKITEENLPISIENVHTDYSDEDSLVTFKCSNGNRLKLFFPAGGGCNFIAEADAEIVRTPRVFRREFPISIQIVPVLGPVEHEEVVLSEDTVRRGLSTHRASRHFRNYWRYYPDGFDEFASLIQRTWPGLDIQRPELSEPLTRKLVMFCLENRISREIYWAGFGFQVWCQLLTHVARAKDASLLVVDEPEVYLHPDVQRQLVGILRDAGPDILMASHSTEIMSEADASEIILIDKTKHIGRHLHDIEGVQAALEAVGSIQNITLTQLARSGRLLFVEGLDDFKVLRRFAKIAKLSDLATGVDITAVESEGFSSWDRTASAAWGFEKALGGTLRVGAIFDRDYYSDEEIKDISDKMSRHLRLVHIHSRKEVENYLLNPDVLERALGKALAERERRAGIKVSRSKTVHSILDKVTSQLKTDIQAQLIEKRASFLKKTGKDPATITKETIEWFENMWSALGTRMEVVPGKEVLGSLRKEIATLYSVTLTDFRIIDEFELEEIPSDLRELLRKLEEFRN
jgi:energy-coupling factor transporter ATP-binding protein EcfA2